MTIQKALDLADELKPNMMSRMVKIHFLEEIDRLIHEELIMTHEHTEEQETTPSYDVDTDGGTELLIPEPHDMLYVYFIMSKIDHLNQEIDKYNNDRAMFETEYEETSDWWTRTHHPLQRTREFRI